MNRNSRPYRPGYPQEGADERNTAQRPPSAPQRQQPLTQGDATSLQRRHVEQNPPAGAYPDRAKRDLSSYPPSQEGAATPQRSTPMADASLSREGISRPQRYPSDGRTVPPSSARSPYPLQEGTPRQQPQRPPSGQWAQERQAAPRQQQADMQRQPQRTPSSRLPDERQAAPRQQQADMQRQPQRTPSSRLPDERQAAPRQQQADMQRQPQRTPSSRLPDERQAAPRQQQADMQRQPQRTPSSRLPDERQAAPRQQQADMQRQPQRTPSGRLPDERQAAPRQQQADMQRQPQRTPSSRLPDERQAAPRQQQADMQRQPQRTPSSRLPDERQAAPRQQQADMQRQPQLPRPASAPRPDEMKRQREAAGRQLIQRPAKAGVPDLFGENDETEELSARDKQAAAQERLLPSREKDAKRRNTEEDEPETETLGKGSKGGDGGGKKSPKSARRMILVNIAKSLLVVACVCIAAVSVFVVVLSNYIVTTVDDGNMTVDLNDLALKETSFFEAYNEDTGEVEEYQKLVLGMDSLFAPLADIPEDMQNAVIAIEDESFKTHHGFNLRRTLQAALNQVIKYSDTDFGASTIDQQLVKNLTGDDVVTGEDGSATAGYERKMREIYLAYIMNNQYSKPQIMEGYLNTLPLGGMVVGVKAAAKNYFNKDVKDLTIVECATLAGITKAPGAFNPRVNPDACRKRRNDVLFAMNKQGYIDDPSKLQEYYDSPLGLDEQPVAEGETVASGVFSYFSDTAFEALIPIMQEMNPSMGVDAAKYEIYTGGYHFELTVDLKLQKAIEEVYALGYTDDNENAVFPSGMFADVKVKDKDGNETGEVQRVWTQSAMAVVDYEGKLRGVVGGIGPKTKSLEQNRGYDSNRSIGSTVKPIGPYVLGIDWGIVNYSTRMADAPSRPGTPERRDPDTGEIINEWPPNYSKTYSETPVLVADALAQSLNTIPVIIGDFIGAEVIYEFLKDTLMVDSLTANDANIAPMALGSMDVGMTPVNLAAIYQIMGNGGRYHPVQIVERIRDSQGNIIWEAPDIEIQAIDEGTSFIMNRLMSNVLGSSAGTETAVNGTANGMKPAGDMDAAAKTGTTDDHTDRWIVGLTPYYISAVWWGFDYNHSLRAWPNTPARNPHVVAWKTIMERVQANLPFKEFPSMPDNIEAHSFCRESGGLATDGCHDIQQGYYRNDLDGTVAMPPVCPVHGDPNADPFPSS